MSDIVIGIDGGGTRTRAQLADLKGLVLGKGEAGTSNPVVHGIAAAEHEIETAISRAFEDAHVPPRRAAALVMGLGGAGRTREQVELAEWTRARYAQEVKVVHDAEIVLAAGVKEHWGVALIAGTGSFAWGRNKSGETARAGGWGYLLGDEGSGFDLARQALRAATQFADGRSESTRLLDDILQFWDLGAPHDLIGAVYHSGLTHSDLAKLAPVVMNAAETGDKVAERLVGEAGEALAAAVAAVGRRLELDLAPFPLALTGGLLLGSMQLRREVETALERQKCRATPIELVQEPVRGAVRLAVELAIGNIG